jgi:glycosyltransferase involved in cell wall biosynthesis
VLYNFVDTKTFAWPGVVKKNNGDFRLISVGSLKLQKNQLYLLEAFTKLKGQNISLDIYGEGGLRPVLEEYIRDHQLPVRLMGQAKNLNELLGGYDLFVMPSLYEGFSLAVLEGMLMEIPMLLSDIGTFREQCADTAVYFSLGDVNGPCR